MRCVLEKMERDSTELLVGRTLGEDFEIGSRMRGDGSSRGYTSGSGRYTSTPSDLGNFGLPGTGRHPSIGSGERGNPSLPFGLVGNERRASVRDNGRRDASAAFDTYAEYISRQMEDSQGGSRPRGPTANPREDSRGALYYSADQRRDVRDARADPTYRPRTPRHNHIDPRTAPYAEEQAADARRPNTAARNPRLQDDGEYDFMRRIPSVRDTVASYDMFGTRLDRNVTPSRVHDHRPNTARRFLRGDGQENNGIGGWS